MEIQKLKIDKKKAYIIDNVLSFEQLKRIYAASIKLPFTLTQKSDGENFINNNRFGYHLTNEDFNESFYYLQKAHHKILKKLKLFNKLIIADIYVNISDLMTPTLMHSDRPNKCWTLLYYANFEWNLNWGGHTLFYHPKTLEVVTAVKPKPGRFALFQADIPHQATPPTFYCPYKRITIPFKMDPIDKSNKRKEEKENNGNEYNPYRESNSCWIS